MDGFLLWFIKSEACMALLMITKIDRTNKIKNIGTHIMEGIFFLITDLKLYDTFRCGFFFVNLIFCSKCNLIKAYNFLRHKFDLFSKNIYKIYLNSLKS